MDLLSDESLDDETRRAGLRQVLSDCGVFEQAEALVEKARARAESLAEAGEVEPLRRLLYFLVDTVLAAGDEASLPTPTPEDVLLSLPIAQ